MADEDLVALQDRLDREAEVRNAVANAERFWEGADRPRGPFVPPGEPGSGATDPAWYSRSSPSRCAPVARDSQFVRQCLAVAEWAGAGVEVSEDGFPADSFEDDGLGCALIAPDLMWVTCVRAGLVKVVGLRAVSTVGSLDSDAEWADLGLQLVGNLLICMEDVDPVLYAMTDLFSPGFGGWAAEVLTEWWWVSMANAVGQRAASPDPSASDDAVRRALELLGFLGVFEVAGEHEGRWVPTALGHDVGLAVLHLGMHGVFRTVS